MKKLRAQIASLDRPDAAKAASVDIRMVALMRCMLALSALLVVAFDPTEPLRFDRGTYVALLAYCVYSVLLCIATIDGHEIVPPRSQHWIDVIVYVGLVALTGGTSGMFYHFFFFAILVASFSRGFDEGFAVTAASATLFAIVSLVMATPGADFDFDEAVTRPVYVLVLGYMMAYWGEHELTLRRRLQLLGEVAELGNPRLGVDQALAHKLHRLLGFFAADACVLVCARGNPAQYLMYRAVAADTQSGIPPQPLTEQSARALLELPGALSLAWQKEEPQCNRTTEAQCRRVANLLETSRFATVPYHERGAMHGRLYLAGGRRSLSPAETDFLRQAVEQIAAAAENVGLLNELMTNAAQLERARLSRDIHDTTIQPYIGLKLGLEALYRTLERGSPVARQVRELLDMAAAVIEELRGYVARLRSNAPGWAAEHLLSGLSEHIGRYRSFYGIEVELRADSVVRLSDRVAGEVHQIVCEGLSNVYKHTAAKRAFVELRCDGQSLAIEVGNEHEPGLKETFMPRSIAERARALGGTTEVSLDNGGHDIVRVAIPL
jgi:signal transduction histidine kinase